MRLDKSILIILLIIVLPVTMLSLTLTFPAPTYAHPPLNLTPQPEPPPPADNGGSDDSGSNSDSPADDNNSDDGGSTSTDIIDIELEPCGQPVNTDGELLAFTGSDAAAPIAPAVTNLPEVLAPVQLVHEDSGWIAEGELSTMQPTRFVVPYPGRWDVSLTAPPSFNTTALVDASGLNLADLHVSLSSGPLALGVVEANAVQTQSVPCPITRITTDIPSIPAPAAEPGKEQIDPSYLPVTGLINSDNSAQAGVLVISVFLVSLMIVWGCLGLRKSNWV